MLRMIFHPISAIERPIYCARQRQGESDTEVLFHCRDVGRRRRTPIRREFSSVGRADGNEPAHAAAVAFAFILDPRQEIRPRLSGGNHKFSNARLKAGSLTDR
jgi:hypothetical protein